MTTHEPTVRRIDNGPACWPTYEIEWPNGEPAEGDTVLLSAELFARSIAILSGECPSCRYRMEQNLTRSATGGCDGSCAEPKCRNGMPLLAERNPVTGVVTLAVDPQVS